MITICRKAFFYEQLKLGKISFFEVPIKDAIKKGTKVEGAAVINRTNWKIN